VAFWTDNFLNKRRNDWIRSIAKVQYRIGGTWYDGVINSKTISGNAITVIADMAGVPAGSQTISEIRLIDEGGQVAGSKLDSITKAGSQGVLVKFEFPLTEV
jgi:hypothetical protein